MAVANMAPPLTILLGNGSGAFTKTSVDVSAAAGGPYSVAVGDFNGDGVPDLAVANYFALSMSMLLGNGDGTFSTIPASAATSLSVFSVATGDFNGDGLADVAAGSAPGMGSIARVLLSQSGWTAMATAPDVLVSSLGTHLIDATYPGDSNYKSSVSGTIEVEVARATLSSPTPGTQLADSNVTFSWTAGSGVTEYELWIGSTGVGSSNLYNGAPTTGVSATVTGLPAHGSTIYARLSSRINGTWQFVDYTYTAVGAPVPATLTSPTPGSHLTSPTVTFGWTAGIGVAAYQLGLGTTGVGSSDLYAGGATTALSATVSALPTTGVMIYARLSSRIDGIWQPVDYTYKAEGEGPPAIYSPTPGSTLPGTTATFSWTSGNPGTVYQLWVGNSVGLSDIYKGATTKATQATVNGLCGNTGVGVRLRWLVNQVWHFSDYTVHCPETAWINDPTPGTKLSGSTAGFAIMAAPNSGGSLCLGTTGLGSCNLGGYGFNNDEGQDESYITATGLPTNGVRILRPALQL